MKLNQKGVTLVELLAALVLVSIVATIAWTALSIGFKHTAAETSKTQLQQDANLIVTKLTNEHRRNDYYYLQMNAGHLEIKTCNDQTSPAIAPCGTFVRLTDANFKYTGTINGIQFASWNAATKIDPKNKHVELVLNVADPVKPTRSVEVKTTLTRILTN
ncbi:prepilin-type N-terminal cleavage/methylation domain-containing protein [Planococcus glaciei]|uniref:Prepilin-type N-terminal cleavage/methylation domain-containing protein n=1 Tax=Planococcus glaciei TaxID=459472 RepID=A0A7H8QCL5_9BACL|nr:prepilin-type N-terminal cleavage/methylation domain-containing protein [Planococcus glaciei]QKX51717.1 prepilin-type N-terminal cleavage/methylation domain-containing protein [Planococcus glaciei]